MLNPKQLMIFVHKFVIIESKELDGIHNSEAFDSVPNSIFHTFNGQALYPSVEDKAAFLAFGIIKDHIFKNGNKRTAVGVMLQFLKLHGISLAYTQQDLIDLGLKIATSVYGKEEIIEWIHKHKK